MGGQNRRLVLIWVEMGANKGGTPTYRHCEAVNFNFRNGGFDLGDEGA